MPRWLNWLSLRKIKIHPTSPKDQVFIAALKKKETKLNIGDWKLWIVSVAIRVTPAFQLQIFLMYGNCVFCSSQLLISVRRCSNKPRLFLLCLSLQMGRAKDIQVTSVLGNTCYFQSNVLSLPFLIQFRI